MAFQLCVLSNRELSSIAEWQQAIDAERFSFKFEDGPFHDMGGYLPVLLMGDESGFDYLRYQVREVLDPDMLQNFGGPWKYMIAFSWSDNGDDRLAAWMAATAYARATGGVVLNQTDDAATGSLVLAREYLHTPQEAVRIVREIDYGSPSKFDRAWARMVVKMMRPIRAYYFPQ